MYGWEKSALWDGVCYGVYTVMDYSKNTITIGCYSDINEMAGVL